MDFETSFSTFIAGCRAQKPRQSFSWALIQVDIGGHPPFPTGSKQFSGNFGNLLFLAVFRVLNFRSRFEALNDVFWENGEQHGTKFNVSHTKVVFLG
jgi:hypothetical protein